MPDPSDESPLPDYDNPPVVETILGVQFDPLPKFRNAHLGAFWKTLVQDEWPEVRDAPPLPPQFERFTKSARWGSRGMEISLSQDLSSRLQIRSRGGDRMIQVQNGRLHFNWLGQEGGDYPRYASVREGFSLAVNWFVDFISHEGLGAFRPNQWEVTYLNHVPRGTTWNGPDDWTFFRPLGDVRTLSDLVHGESFEGEWHFSIPPDRGRLHVRWQHGLESQPEQTEIIILTFTARGPIPEGNDVPAILRGVDLGRETIVRSFHRLMSDQANQFWELKHAGD